MLSREFAFCLFINSILHIEVGTRVYDDIWKKHFSGVTSRGLQ